MLAVDGRGRQGSVREFSELIPEVFDGFKRHLSTQYHAIDPDLVAIATAASHIRQEHLPRTGDLVSLLATTGPKQGMCLGCWWSLFTGVHVMLLQAPIGVIVIPFKDIVDVRGLAP